jgi:hypothetical protein
LLDAEPMSKKLNALTVKLIFSSLLIFLNWSGKAKTDELDKAIERYSHVLQEEVNCRTKCLLPILLGNGLS